MAYADNKSIMAEMVNYAFEKVENIVGKEANTCCLVKGNFFSMKKRSFCWCHGSESDGRMYSVIWDLQL